MTLPVKLLFQHMAAVVATQALVGFLLIQVPVAEVGAVQEPLAHLVVAQHTVSQEGQL